MSDEGEVAPTINEVLEKAKRLGYDPDRYAQDDPKFKTPEQFIEFGEQLNPILRENNKRLDAENAALKTQIKQIQVEVEKFAKVHEQTQKEAYAKALADLRVERKEALAEGDFDRAEEVTDKIEQTKTAAVQSVAAQVVETVAVPPQVQVDYSEWLQTNPWAHEGHEKYDPEMEAYGRAMGELLVRKMGVQSTGTHFRPFLDQVAGKVRERFPDKFTNPLRRGASSVETGEATVAISPSKHSYAQLPKEAKESCDMLVKTIPGYTKEKYIASYQWSK